MATGNFLTDANNYITFSAEYAATAASSKVKKMAELFSLKSNKKEASNIKLNLIKIFQSNKQLQRIDDATYAKLINEINSLSDEELIELGKSIQSSAQVGVTTDGAAIISL